MTGFDHELEPIDVAARPPPPPPSGPSRRGRRPLAVAVAGLVVLGGLGAVARDRSSGSEAAPAVEDDAGRFWSWGADGSGDEPAPAGWRRGDPGPVQPRDGHVTLWTGSELLVWGGDPAGEGAPIGAAYDPGRDRWRAMIPPTFPVPSQPVAVWSGFEMLVWGGQEAGRAGPAGGGAYDPLADRWRPFTTSPLTARAPLVGVWTGRELVIAGGTGDGRRGPSPEAAAYDPAADRWRVLPPMPVTLTDAVGLWTGTEVVVVGAALEMDNSSLDPEGKPRATAFDPARNQWRTLPPPPLSPQALTAVWTEEEIVAWDYELHATGFDPSAGGQDRWYGLPDLPLDFAGCYPKGAWTGDVVFAEYCGQGAVYRPSTAEWARVAHPRQLDAAPVWTGDELLFWVGRFVGSTDGLWRFRSPPPRPVGPVPPVLGTKRR